MEQLIYQIGNESLEPFTRRVPMTQLDLFPESFEIQLELDLDQHMDELEYRFALVGDKEISPLVPSTWASPKNVTLSANL